MTKSATKKRTNTFVNGIKSEHALRAYTVALGYVMTRDRDQAIKLLEAAIDQERRNLRKVNTRRQQLATAALPPEFFIRITNDKSGGYVNREGYATLDKAQAYRWGSRDAAVQYITDNVTRLGHMTLEEAPKRG